jgi:hydroxymethylpyrimidine/phosphomethylpyrimidine kinase
VVVDPVMIAKGGAALLQKEAIDALKWRVFPLADVITPNIPEAQALTGMRSIIHWEHKLEAVVRLHGYGPKYVILKGGHDESDKERAVDLLYDVKRSRSCLRSV